MGWALQLPGRLSRARGNCDPSRAHLSHGQRWIVEGRAQEESSQVVLVATGTTGEGPNIETMVGHNAAPKGVDRKSEGRSVVDESEDNGLRI